MMEKGQMAPKDYILEFIETLKIEIEELKNSKDNNILLAENQSSMKDLRSNHSALALELSNLEKWRKLMRQRSAPRWQPLG